MKFCRCPFSTRSIVYKTPDKRPTLNLFCFKTELHRLWLTLTPLPQISSTSCTCLLLVSAPSSLGLEVIITDKHFSLVYDRNQIAWAAVVSTKNIRLKRQPTRLPTAISVLQSYMYEDLWNVFH